MKKLSKNNHLMSKNEKNTQWIKKKSFIVIVYLFFIKSHVVLYIVYFTKKINPTNKINDAFDFKIVGQIFDKKLFF